MVTEKCPFKTEKHGKSIKEGSRRYDDIIQYYGDKISLHLLP